MLKPPLRAAERLLPEHVYVRLYPAAFSLYRFLVRILYIRFILVHMLRGDKANLVKARQIHRVMPYSVVGWRGLSATYDATLDVEVRGLEGSFVECGVAQGGSAALMGLVAATAARGRMIWLFDSFEGLPPPTADDYESNSGTTGSHIRPLAQGSCLGTYEEVEKLLFDKLHLSRANISLVKGWFEDTIPLSAEMIRPVAILRIDADWYQSVRTCLEHLYDNVVPAGYIIIDDYGTCVGAQKAVDEFISKRSLEVELVPDGRGGVLFSKPLG